jgi:hypothetical protein
MTAERSGTQGRGHSLVAWTLNTVMDRTRSVPIPSSTTSMSRRPFARTASSTYRLGRLPVRMVPTASSSVDTGAGYRSRSPSGSWDIRSRSRAPGREAQASSCRRLDGRGSSRTLRRMHVRLRRGDCSRGTHQTALRRSRFREPSHWAPPRRSDQPAAT